jgi:hypothetical protein
MPTLKRDREAMADDGARKKIKTEPVDDTSISHSIMDPTAAPKPVTDTSIAQDLKVNTPSLLTAQIILTCIHSGLKHTPSQL